MSERPTWPAIWLNLAVTLSERSTCKRLRVGCVIVDPNNTKVLAIGYNGNYRGGPHGCDSDQPGKCGCLHAEENALLKYSRQYHGGILYCTHLPCVMCAKRIVNSGGIFEVVYLHAYRDQSSKEIFRNTNVEVKQFDGAYWL
jgi:dCMP deaminase